jgi:SAM-dependent methyltransferase
MEEPRFRFGRNWQSFREKAWSEARVNEAVRGLDALVGRASLEGKSFLDIGSGSGLHSLAAKKLGASKVVSFDYDKDSVACTKEVRDAGPDGEKKGWEVKQGSVLDLEFMRSLGTFDIVYSWAVLHHTGDMWKAIEQAMIPVRPGGLFAIAIYNRVKGKLGTLSSEQWAKVKRAYSEGTPLRQNAMLAAFVAWRLAVTTTDLRNPIREIREYKKSRGMSWMHDARDWVGGYPYEFATSEELERFFEKRGFRVKTKIPIEGEGWGNNQLVFESTRS